jgi:hypothetical protein
MSRVTFDRRQFILIRLTLSLFVLAIFLTAISGLYTNASATPININQVNQWINIGPLDFQGTQKGNDDISLQFINLVDPEQIWTSFHIMLPKKKQFIKTSATIFSQQELTPDSSTITFWDGMVKQDRSFGVTLDATKGDYKIKVKATATPEPTTFVLMSFGILGLFMVIRQRRKEK